ncbi:hypothetical protein MRB53_030662 [Persea americana]|uniref:Uncharacterized protein n=1 Tax=Persea americana TaxID=3435 RepID=A0ACC2KLX9_PERAE|nr:hypothetical protein MRB53_030662 [Persea americana]
MRSGGFYYKDRLGHTKGPCELVTLKSARGSGIIDTQTFIWGEDMDGWAPIGMVYGMEKAIATWEESTLEKRGMRRTHWLWRWRRRSMDRDSGDDGEVMGYDPGASCAGMDVRDEDLQREVEGWFSA